MGQRQAARFVLCCRSAGIAGEESTEQGTIRPSRWDFPSARLPATIVSEVMDDPGDIVDKLDDVKDALEPEDGKLKYRPVFLSTNAITLANQVQLVTPVLW